MLHGQESESPACTWAFDASYCEALRAKSAIPSPVCPHSSNPLGAQLSFQWPAKLEVTPTLCCPLGLFAEHRLRTKKLWNPFFLHGPLASPITQSLALYCSKEGTQPRLPTDAERAPAPGPVSLQRALPPCGCRVNSQPQTPHGS